MKLSAAVLAIAALMFAGLGHAQHQASGKVTKVDRAAGRVTIAHGPVASLKWPAMTMAFEVKDKALFDKLQPGASIEFSFVQSERKHVVTAVE
jgi:Cu(I)/Ag(I) efflux system protein CusF